MTQNSESQTMAYMVTGNYCLACRNTIEPDTELYDIHCLPLGSNPGYTFAVHRGDCSDRFNAAWVKLAEGTATKDDKIATFIALEIHRVRNS